MNYSQQEYEFHQYSSYSKEIPVTIAGNFSSMNKFSLQEISFFPCTVTFLQEKLNPARFLVRSYQDPAGILLKSSYGKFSFTIISKKFNRFCHIMQNSPPKQCPCFSTNQHGLEESGKGARHERYISKRLFVFPPINVASNSFHRSTYLNKIFKNLPFNKIFKNLLCTFR